MYWAKSYKDAAEQISGGHACALWARPDLATFSCASRASLRSMSHPEGLPTLTVADGEYVKRANDHVKELVQLLELCGRHETLVSVEAPASSSLWWQPRVVQLAFEFALGRSTYDLCAYGRSYRKRTSITHNSELLHQGLSRSCKCTRAHNVMAGSVFVRGQRVSAAAAAMRMPKLLASCISQIVVSWYKDARPREGELL